MRSLVPATPVCHPAEMAQTGNSGRRQRLPPAQRRALILSAALDMFADRGHETTLAEVAGAAGVTRTVLYYYFPSKEVLTCAVIEMAASELIGELAPAITTKADPSARARATSIALGTFLSHRPRVWDLIFHDREDDSSEIRSTRATTRFRVMTAVGALLAPDLSAAGLAPSDDRAVLVGEMTVGALAAAGRWRRAHPEMPLEEFAATIYDLLWLGTRGYTDHAT